VVGAGGEVAGVALQCLDDAQRERPERGVVSGRPARGQLETARGTRPSSPSPPPL
jgi:hypothetical protein